ncbi:periplasmic chaperone for outer membrane proteins SurA [Limimaricola soesokkakensis]|uniref:Parvulin-like PPIase n=1 Tax=Limimaricola soesokkakensis TaxID=1343159 RepID=A0A1X6ZU58_9RHOB|nr:peptidylprolyl isomerase [Limimaricola soesokkakensis]PSK82936.1 periplasmic chaperone for outer membrane proteins SurA [Limimaricola soesokkakensis]SLN61268.1 Chaperone SurA precursor [Limimaricola soesokkakensis]
MRAFDVVKAVALATALAAPVGAAAQGLFAPAVTVNGSAVTNYELDQRAKLLAAFNTPGDLGAEARKQLVEEKLKLQELNRAGMQLTEEGLEAAMAEFAQRANLSLDAFLAQLATQGVARETLRDFVRVNASWRDYIRRRYGSGVDISEAEIDAALARTGGPESVELLLSEIIIPAPPPRAAAAMARAEAISKLRSTAAFEAEARVVSALPSRTQGGRLDWAALSDYPAGLHGLLLSLEPGEVTPPIPIRNGVALFQLRDIREAPKAPAAIAEIDYAQFAIPGAGTAQALAEAARIDGLVDTCDDLYGVAKGLPEERLVRQSVAPASLPQDLGLELARLDPDEASWNLSQDGTLLFTMLCSRTPVAAEGVDREAVRNQLLSQKLSARADILLAELRAQARIGQ